ncbi:uncharacterized protein DUF1801 [Herbihabitans rhizosphaerae]|uniref:Uncharacterized protein DUF1801 n=1 Tax=Herbihabitans rhizosphaerae TaxID=1872711 RepID=A0A4Q7L607_9PSEU|nr:DUF1801 domain-containing protein [Herbihabitans rhizosphaerae]RZS44724.1 uncharacterized protein DUF1801 [Herbihabitans rhizosphaerae]
MSTDAEALANLLAQAEPRLERATKWGRLTFTLDQNWHHWICQIAESKKGAKLVFHKGVLLDDPAGLLTGSARYLREVSAERALADTEAIRALVRSAVEHQTDMVS